MRQYSKVSSAGFYLTENCEVKRDRKKEGIRIHRDIITTCWIPWLDAILVSDSQCLNSPEVKKAHQNTKFPWLIFTQVQEGASKYLPCGGEFEWCNAVNQEYFGNIWCSMTPTKTPQLPFMLAVESIMSYQLILMTPNIS